MSGEKNRKIFSVLELTLTIKQILERDHDLQNISARGEISNLTKHSSGHYYFSIKDKGSQLTCIMFRYKASNLNFEPKHGDQVIVTGDVNVYEQRGNYQLLVNCMKKDGLGELHKRFLELKEKLEKEGVFKKNNPIPKFPKIIGVVSSPTGAALQDILDTIKRRFPCVKVIISPALVQGESSAPSIVNAISILNKINDTKEKVDTIIVARGGGSLEDLWSFNEEIVAREIYNCKIPIISGVGHETDFTITDFVADLRAPTPSIAAELAAPLKYDYLELLRNHHKSIARLLENPIVRKTQSLDEFHNRIMFNVKFLIQNKKEQINLLLQKLKSLDVNSTLKRGFSITMLNDHVIKSTSEIKEKDIIKTILSEGEFLSEIK
ncbi:exodeoxyribonuclease VII large subunit [archaeon]|jgi:exodeoxyribonuclease VII large subunit|nr:exodeoxyribonuclease VII large subunit [archaeon]MBT3451518.1 exodeoxyribonuclease VII large subunit [archaeon]MBT6869512.1 exodeoxyribonuclease VII large subunit [archaeon]MBT7193200.1 exodeoxyribonuclease VII large subunit [archaeon]MBT7380506.1 exodeoxyribonuclease VII large subunit [archaeon]